MADKDEFKRPQKPSVGRIVLFRSNDHGWLTQDAAPAIITHVNPDGTVNLRVFPDISGDIPCVANVPFDDNLGAIPAETGYWRWPPRE